MGPLSMLLTLQMFGVIQGNNLIYIFVFLCFFFILLVRAIQPVQEIRSTKSANKFPELARSFQPQFSKKKKFFTTIMQMTINIHLYNFVLFVMVMFFCFFVLVASSRNGSAMIRRRTPSICTHTHNYYISHAFQIICSLLSNLFFHFVVVVVANKQCMPCKYFQPFVQDKEEKKCSFLLVVAI